MQRALLEVGTAHCACCSGQGHIVRDAWARGQTLSVHGWVYSLQDGLLRELGLTAAHDDEADEAYREAVERMSRAFSSTPPPAAKRRRTAHA